MTTFGVTPTGFTVKQQQTIIKELQAAHQQAFGVNVNLAPQTVLGQVLGIYSEREALLWQLAEAVYASQYPAGAEGTSVDNILSLNNLTRDAARATVTAPTDSLGVPGLVLYGTAGTIIGAGSIITVQNNSLLQFTLDAAVTILASVNAVQMIVLSAPPTTGSFAFTLLDPAGNTLTSPSLPWYTPAAETQLAWSQLPASGNFSLSFASAVGAFNTPSRAWNVSTAQIQTDIRALNAAYAGVLVTGSVSGAVLAATGNLANGSFIVTALTSTAGLVIGMAVSGANIPGGAFITNIIGNAVFMSQAATATATETVTFSGALIIDWTSVSQPTVGFHADTLDQAGAIYNSLQSVFNSFFDSLAANYPYTDVTCSGALAAAALAINFGAGTVIVGQPVSSAQPQSLIDVTADSLQTGTTIVNSNVLNTAVGAPAQGVGSATCSQTGPNAVPAGYLSVIGSPAGGWSAVTNPLDCIIGANVENDTQALIRREQDLASNANGPIQAIAEKVSLIPNVVQAIGFQNLSLAALQILTFSAVPSSGQFTLAFNGGLGLQVTPLISYRAFSNVQAIYFSGVPTGGSFTITMNALTTSAISYTANASGVQAAVRALGTSFANTIVTGSYANGFLFAFGAGSVQQYPITTADSLSGASISAVVPSVQAQINAVAGYGQATVVGSFAATMVVAFNGSTGGQAQAAITSPTNSLLISATPVTITPSFGRPGKSFEIVVSDNNGEASDQVIGETIFGAAPAGIMSYGNQTPVSVSDSFGNVYQMYFSRPTQVPFYVILNLVTDLTTSANPQFNVSSIINIQEDIVAIGNLTPIGGLVIGFGSGGLIGAFNAIPGVTFYTLFFGTSANPTDNTNVQLLPEQVALFETFSVIVSYQ